MSVKLKKLKKQKTQSEHTEKTAVNSSTGSYNVEKVAAISSDCVKVNESNEARGLKNELYTERPKIGLKNGPKPPSRGSRISKNSKILREVNKYEWGKTKLLSRDHKVFYDTLRIIGTDETIEVKTGSHIIIENQDDRKKPFVARVTRFFEDTKMEIDKKRVVVEWYVFHNMFYIKGTFDLEILSPILF